MIAAFERSYYEENVAELNLNFVLNSQEGWQNFQKKKSAIPEFNGYDSYEVYDKFIMNYLNVFEILIERTVRLLKRPFFPVTV